MKKYGFAIIGMVLAASLGLTACGSDNGGNDASGSSAPAGGSPSASASSSSADGAADVSKLPERTISVFVPGVPQKDTALINEEASKYLKDKINAKLDLEIIDWGSWQDKMNLKLASGEDFDIMWTTSWDNYFTRVAKGSFLPLNDLLDQYGQDAKSILPPALLQGGLINGKNYGLPVNKEMASYNGILLNKKYVDKYNIDIGTIKSLEDLEPYLKEIKENEPGVTPFLMNKSLNAYNVEINKDFSGVSDFAVVDRNTPADDLKVFNVFEDPRMKAVLELTRKWYQAGYINQDAATLQDIAGAIKAGNWFAYNDTLKPGKDAESSNAYGVQMVQVPLTTPIVSTGDALGSMMSISATSKDPERDMMFLNLLYTDKYLVNLLSFGIEGKHYVKKSDNVISFPDGVTAATSTYNPGTAYMFGNQFNDYLFDNEDPNKWTNFENFNKEAVNSKVLGFNMNIDPIKNETAAYQNAFAEFTPGLFTGAVDPDEVLPKFLDKMKSIGSDKIIAEAQKQVDAWKASK